MESLEIFYVCFHRKVSIDDEANYTVHLLGDDDVYINSRGDHIDGHGAIVRPSPDRATDKYPSHEETGVFHEQKSGKGSSTNKCGRVELRKPWRGITKFWFHFRVS